MKTGQPFESCPVFVLCGITPHYQDVAFFGFQQGGLQIFFLQMELLCTSMQRICPVLFQTAHYINVPLSVHTCY